MDSKKGRRALVVLAAAGGCALAAGVLAPAACFVSAPARRSAGGEGRWVPTIGLDKLKEGEPARVAIVADRHDGWTRERDVELGSVWLVREGARVRALSAACPHLGCAIQRAPATGAPDAARGFACPCHTSAFDGSGRRVSGPSPRDMDELATRVDEGGMIHVDFRRFRVGVTKRVEA